MSLPTTRNFITQLLDSLPSISNHTGENVNPLSAVPESAKNQLLSLQVLFPNEFLPALDLLDRRLVTRISVDNREGEDAALKAERDAGGMEQGRSAVDAAGQSEIVMEDAPESGMEEHIPSVPAQHAQHDSNAANVPPHTAQPATKDAIYYVRSAQARSSRYSTSFDTTASYEVRLRAWNCSCPAFAFAAFPAVHPEPAVPVYEPQEHAADDESAEGTSKAWVFGGASLGDAIPPVCKHLLACVLVEKCSGLFGGYVEERVVSVEEAAGWAAGWGD